MRRRQAVVLHENHTTLPFSLFISLVFLHIASIHVFSFSAAVRLGGIVETELVVRGFQLLLLDYPRASVHGAVNSDV